MSFIIVFASAKLVLFLIFAKFYLQLLTKRKKRLSEPPFCFIIAVSYYDLIANRTLIPTAIIFAFSVKEFNTLLVVKFSGFSEL